jgi:FAD/FMN-containing dehydrogenase
MPLKTDLAAIVGSERVSDAPDVLDKYSRDYSMVQPRKPSCVVHARNTEEIQKVVRYAKDRSIPVTPRSSAVGFYGAGIPGEGGIIIDLTGMNRVLEIDEKDRKVKVEPGVTWSQLQQELVKHGMMVCNPLLPHPLKSVLTSTMERETSLIPKYEYNETFLTAEMVLPTGDLFWTGTAIGKGHTGKSNPEGVIPSTRLFLGSQGTLGIATWANLRAVYLPTMTKPLFIPLNKIEDALAPSYQILRARLGNEFLVLDSLNLASILARNTDELNTLRENLPPYTIILCLAGLHRYPEDKIAYEEEALTEIASREHFDLCHTVAGIPDLGDTMPRLLRQPWSEEKWWKYRYKGQRYDIFFHTTLDRVPEFTGAMFKMAERFHYPTRDISFYLQPKEQGRVCYCEYGLYCDPDNAGECATVPELFREASEEAMCLGGLFTNPYGQWADMVYSRANSYAATLKLLKGILDPAHIMNPGKLCF